MSDASQMLVFDRRLVRQRRARAAARFHAHDAVLLETAMRLEERLSDVKRGFEAILDLGAHDGKLAARLAARAGAFTVAADLAEPFLRGSRTPSVSSVAADEEALPFAPGSFDLVVSNMSLHWVNDLPGALAQIRALLKPGGLFLAALPGGETLGELRACLLEAEAALSGGAGPRLSPSLDLGTASALLQRAGFALPVADQERVTLTYPDIYALMRDLRGVGETAAHLHRPRRALTRAVLKETDRLMHERFPAPGGRIAATLDLIFLHGWG